MWMCYVHELEITDLKSGVNHLIQKFENLEFDAAHESVYGMGRFLPEEQCTELAEKYAKGATVCTEFIEGNTCESCLVKGLIDLGLTGFLYRIEEYLSPEPLSLLKKVTEESDEDDEESGPETNLEDCTHL